MTLANVPRYDGEAAFEIGNRAVVVGGSVAGLLTARVLSDWFEEVTVVDSDPLPDDPTARRSVPQADHVHVLLEAGRVTLEDLLPGYGEELLSAGGLMIDATSDLYYHEEGDFLADGTARVPMYCASRPLFEHVVRRQVIDLDSVTFRPNCHCTEYLTGDGDEAVEGITVRPEGADVEELSADLVVDATGRASRTPTWLDDHGYPAPPVDEVEIDLAYSTTFVERPPDDRRMLYAPTSAPRTRGGAAIPVEGNRWQVSMQGMHGDHPPTDPQEFKEYAASLPMSEIETILETQQWVTEDIEYHPIPSSLRRHYEDLDRFPDGLLVVGDAITSFNPIYGMGMSVAALEALALHHALADGGTDDLALRFFDDAAEVVDSAWQLAVSGDFEYSQTDGDKPFGTDFFNRYVKRLVRSAHTDGRLTEAFMRVLLFEKPPGSLLRPSILRRVLRP